MSALNRVSGSKLAVVAGLGLAMLIGMEVRSFARPEPSASVAPSAPAVIATVDLEKLMNGLTELSDRNKSLNQRMEVRAAQLNDIKKQIDAVENDLKNNIAENDTKSRTEKLAQKFELDATFEARRNAIRGLVELENGDTIRELYQKTLGYVDAFAQKNGIDLVLFDDRSISFSKRAGVKEVNETIADKRILYANSTLDITQAVLTAMNNEYAAGINVGKNAKP